jgi:hypothetical protein
MIFRTLLSSSLPPISSEAVDCTDVGFSNSESAGSMPSSLAVELPQ